MAEINGGLVKKILLTGMSGNGKSVIVEHLATLGYLAVDLDQPGWSVHAPDGDWIWNESRVRSLLKEKAGEQLFVSGCAENQGKFYELFDRVVLLSAPEDVIRERLRTRTNNSYGKSEQELADVLHYVETVEPLIRRGATDEIDTAKPLEEVVERVLEIAEER
jgi:dephospho-CoA kinase